MSAPIPQTGTVIAAAAAMQTTTQQAQSHPQWQTVEVQVLVHQVQPATGERRTTREVLDGNGRRWGRWEVASRPPLRWD